MIDKEILVSESIEINVFELEFINIESNKNEEIISLIDLLYDEDSYIDFSALKH